jgi:hypothetical protein
LTGSALTGSATALRFFQLRARGQPSKELQIYEIQSVSAAQGLSQRSKPVGTGSTFDFLA